VPSRVRATSRGRMPPRHQRRIQCLETAPCARIPLPTGRRPILIETCSAKSHRARALETSPLPGEVSGYRLSEFGLPLTGGEEKIWLRHHIFQTFLSIRQCGNSSRDRLARVYARDRSCGRAPCPGGTGPMGSGALHLARTLPATGHPGSVFVGCGRIRTSAVPVRLPCRSARGRAHSLGS
jgi:hypothetical protein